MHKLFPSQQADEHIYLILREHWVYFAFKIILWFMFVVLLVIFQFYGPKNLPNLFVGELVVITRLFTNLYTIFLLLSLFLIWMMYYLNVQIITDRRIVDIDQVGLFSHVVSELHIENIEDVTSETNGLLGNIFNYGMVYVQTAGTKDRFEFNNVPNPGSINKLMLELYEKLPRNHKA